MFSYTDEFKLLCQHAQQQPGSGVTVSCHLSPEISAAGMEIRWFKETRCVCLYKNGQVIEGKGYEGRVSLFTQELETGNISLQLKESTELELDLGHYLCQVTDGDRTQELAMGVLMNMDTGRCFRSLDKFSIGICSRFAEQAKRNTF